MRKYILLLALPFLLLAIGLVLFAANVPIGDDYDAILNYLNRPWPDRFFHLADFHNEHRIIPTRLVSELVYRALGHIDFRIVIWIGNLGWWIFAGVFAWLFARRGGILRWGAVFACWMLVGFYDQENAFWAMASVQNHGVIAFAFAACLAFSRRADWKWFAVSLSFAVAATFSSGGGLLVFPAMALMAICNWTFSTRLGQSRPRLRRSIAGVLIFVLVASIACGLMLHNLPHNDDPTLVFPSDPVQRIKAVIGFFFCFFGNLIPFPWPALLAGFCVVTWGLVVCWFAPRYRGTSLAIFAFLAFLVAQILAATIFRGCDASCSLPGRYRLISATIIVSLLYLTVVEVPLKPRLVTALLIIVIVGRIALSTIYVSRGFAFVAKQKTKIETGIANWPHSIIGLAYPPWSQKKASAILSKSVEERIYITPFLSRENIYPQPRCETP